MICSAGSSMNIKDGQCYSKCLGSSWTDTPQPFCGNEFQNVIEANFYE